MPLRHSVAPCSGRGCAADVPSAVALALPASKLSFVRPSLVMMHAGGIVPSLRSTLVMMLVTSTASIAQASSRTSTSDDSTPAAPLQQRQLLWYLGDYSLPYVAENQAFIGMHANFVNGVLHCCGGPSVTSNGTMVVPSATRQLYSELTRPEVALKLSPVMLPLSPDPWSVQSGQAERAVPALVDLVVQLGVTGLIADYEPHANTTAAHAKGFASFLAALSSALHARDKQLGVCVSDWGIIGPQYYKLLATADADLYVSMCAFPIAMQTNITLLLPP